MTDQERSAAREFLGQFYSSSANYPFPESSIFYMHQVLTKHEAEVRRRIADEIKRKCAGSHDALFVAEHIVNPPEPPKPLLCEGCGHTETAHVSVMLNGERVLLCSDAKFAPKGGER